MSSSTNETPAIKELTPATEQLIRAFDTPGDPMTKIVQAVKAGADIDWYNGEGSTILHTAAFFGNEEISEFLLANGADINAAGGGSCCTPLHTAVIYEAYEVVRVLIEHGADTSLQDVEGLTALDLAHEQESHKIASLFN